MLLPATTLLVNSVAASWLKFTASVGAVPAARLVILLFAASMPALVTLGPPEMVKPALLITVLPMVTLPAAPKLMLGLSLIATPAAVASVVMLVSPITATASPNFLIPVVPLSPLKVRPVLSIASLASTPALMSSLVVCSKSIA